MNVVRWETPAAFFPWPHVQRYINQIDATVYRVAIKYAQEQFRAQAEPCPQCGRQPSDLFWLSVSDPEAAWDAGNGRVGFLTICESCRLQTGFYIDTELTEMQAEQWRDIRALS